MDEFGMSGPLAGVRVVDLTTTFLGPYCTLSLAQMGADVIKVEAPSGDIVRQLGIGRNELMSPTFLRLNRGKRGVVLDLKREAGRFAFYQIIRRMDVIVHNMRPEAAEELGLDYESVRSENPSIVYCAAFGFGREGPYGGQPAYDDIIQAACGLADLQGRYEGAPRYVASAVADKTCALNLLAGVLAALFERERTGHGQSVTVPMFETMVADTLLEHLCGASFVPPEGDPGYGRLLSPSRRPYRTADGYLSLLLYTDAQWRRFFEAIDRQDLLQDRRFSNLTERSIYIDELYAEVESELSRRTTAAWSELFARIDVPNGPVNSLNDLLHDPHLEAVGFWEPEVHPTEGVLRQIRRTVEFSNHHLHPIMRPAPVLGEHSREVLEEVGISSGEVATMLADGATFDGRTSDGVETEERP